MITRVCLSCVALLALGACGGSPISFPVDGNKQLSDLTDEDAEYATSSGLLAFQDHGHGTIVGFKDIWLKRPADD